MEIAFRFVTPQSYEELKPYLDELRFLASFFPWQQFMMVAIDSVPNLTLVFDRETGLILGAFALDIYKKTVELLGVCRLDLKVVFPEKARYMMPVFTKHLFSQIFKMPGKQNILIKVLDDSPGGKGFARKYGFKFINREKRMTVYKLTKQDYQKQLEIA